MPSAPAPSITIISGGQTGVDRAALDAAIALGVPHGGWCPAGRLAEDGTLPARYLLTETRSRDYSVRTERNVRDSDATLILTWGPPSGGTAYTIECAIRMNRPYLVVDMEGESADPARAAHWMLDRDIGALNVAGPRESSRPGVVHSTAMRFLIALLEALLHQ